MTVRRILAVTAVAGAAVATVGVITAVVFWPDTEPRLSGLSNVITWVWPTVAIGGYWAFLGAAVVVWMPRSTQIVGLGVLTGIGAGLTSAVLPIFYALAGDATIVVVPLGAAAAASLVLALVLAVTRMRPSLHTLGRAVAKHSFSLLFRSGDLLILLVAMVALIGVARFGEAAWSSFINDFHRYAGSAAVWLSNSGVGPDFDQTFGGNYGAGMKARAEGEKPGTTALLISGFQLTGIEPFALLTPLTLISLFAGMSAITAVLRGMFGTSLLSAMAIATAPALSIVPMSRVFDAQLGQVAASAILACVLALIATSKSPRALFRAALVGAALGVILAGGVANNFTVVLSFVPVYAVLALWAFYRSGWRGSRIAVSLAAGAVVILLTLLPFVEGYYRSLRGQTTGVPGVDVAFPSPLALIGLQTELDSGLSSLQLVVVWLFLILTAASVLVTVRRPNADGWFLYVAILLSVVLVLGLGVAFGFENYVVHKWIAMGTPLLIPLLLAATIVHIAKRWRARGVALISAVALASLMIASAHSYQVSNEVPAELLEAGSSAEIGRIDDLNVALGDLHLNSVGPLAMTSKRVHVVESTYTSADAPVGNTFLISESSDERRWLDIQSVADGFWLAELNLTASGRIDFSDPQSDARDHLFGGWYEPDGYAAWTKVGTALVVVDVPREFDGRDIQLTLEGALVGAPAAAGALTVTANGALSMVRVSTGYDAETLALTLSAREVSASDGRIIVELTYTRDTSIALSVENEDPRELGFGLTSITLNARSD